MSTRRLILAALLCGLAILIAGGILLFNMVANRDELTLDPALALGESTPVAGRDVGVSSATADGDRLLVEVALGGGVPGGTAADGWALNAGGEIVAAVEGGDDDCRNVALGTEPVECVLTYPLPDGSALLEYAAEGESARWQVAG